MFTWLPLYKEIAAWLITMRNKQPELCLILRDIGFTGNLDDQNDSGSTPLEVMDPFTFMAFFQKMGHEKRTELLNNLKTRLGFKSALPSDYNGIPSANAQRLWYFKYGHRRQANEIDALWDLSEQAVRGKLQATTFETVYGFKGIRIAKLSHGLFYLNPETFYPIDAHKALLENSGINCEVETLDDYLKIVDQVKEKFKRPLYEVSHEAWKFTNSQEFKNDTTPSHNTDARYWIYSPGKNAYKWMEFYNSGIMALGWDYLGDLSEYESKEDIAHDIREESGEDSSKKNDASANWEFVNKMKVGDFVFAKHGREWLIGFGKVISDYYFDKDANEYQSRRKVSWINKGEWQVDHTLVMKTLTDITDYPSNVPGINFYYERLLKFMSDTKTNYTTEEIKKLFLSYLTNIDSARNSAESYVNNLENKVFQWAKKHQLVENSIFEIYNPADVSRAFDLLEKYEDVKISNNAYFTPMNWYRKFSKTLNLSSDSKQTLEKNLNKILYGPPGTGKTYSTIRKAIEIAHPDFQFPDSGHHAKDRKEIKSEFDRLKAEGQIEFITFHQSLGYEEFIEGIKPLDPDENKGEVKYDVVPGIFRKLCTRAQGNTNFQSAYSGLIRELRSKNDSPIELKTPTNKPFSISENSNGNLSLHTGTEKNKQGVLTKDKLEREINGEKMFFGWEGYSSGVKSYLKEKHGLIENTGNAQKNYVLIIDEINRGNVSQIFGELITLIEEDKRIGKTEAIELRLPYSGELFSVPANLYIIGTMNTADRSVEALDTALRRRFAFEEIASAPEKLATTSDGLDLEKILRTINERIEVLLDRDHQIGHSYFFKVKGKDDLRSVFRDSIIPLLQEYFYGDYGKIALVLGDGFVEYKKDKKVTFATKNYPHSSDFIPTKYVLKKIDDDFDIESAIRGIWPEEKPKQNEETFEANS